MFKYLAILAFLVGASAFNPSARVSKSSSSLKMSAFANELGAQPPLGFWDPLGFLDNKDEAYFES